MDEFFPESTVERALIARCFARRRPLSGTLELTPLCNLRCDMCYVRRDAAEVQACGGLRDAAAWLELGRQMQQCGVLFLILTGGEPLTHPGFRELYTGLQALGMLLTVNTNGTLLDEAWADFFAAHPPRRINLTLYGGGENTYASLCHFPGGYARAARAVRLLKERGVSVKLNASVTKANWAELEEIYRFGAELGVPVAADTYMIPALRERGLPFEQQSRLLPEDAARAHWEALRHEKPPKVLQTYAAQMAVQLARTDLAEHPYPDGMTCLASNCSFAVDWRGRMRPCVTLEEPAVPVFERGFAAAWEEVSREAHCFRIHPRCTTCRLRPICPTCAGSAWLETGRCDGLPEYLCRYAAELERILREENRSNAVESGERV